MSAKGNAPSNTNAPLTNAEVLARLQKQEVLVPDVGELMKSYHQKTFTRYNPHRFAIQPYFDEMLQQIVPKSKDVEGLSGIDFVLMASCFFPKAELRELTTVLNCSAWLYLLAEQLKSSNPWETDYFFTNPDELPGLVKGAKMDPERVLTFVKRSLDPQEKKPIKLLSPNAITDFFQNKISGELMEGCRNEQLDLFLEELEYFMKQAQAEKEALNKGSIPTMDEYRAMRKGSGTGIAGVGVLLSLVQYTARLRLHRKMTDIPTVKKLWDEVIDILWLTNDLQIFPLKEKGQDLFLNCITVYLKESGCLRVQTAADEMFLRLNESISRFEQLAVEIMKEDREYSMSEDEIRVNVDGLRNIFIGNYRWMNLVVSSESESAIVDSDSDSD